MSKRKRDFLKRQSMADNYKQDTNRFRDYSGSATVSQKC